MEGVRAKVDAAGDSKNDIGLGISIKYGLVFRADWR